MFDDEKPSESPQAERSRERRESRKRREKRLDSLKELPFAKKALLLVLAVFAAALASGLLVEVTFSTQDEVQFSFFTVGFLVGLVVGLVFLGPALVYLRFKDRRDSLRKAQRDAEDDRPS